MAVGTMNIVTMATITKIMATITTTDKFRYLNSINNKVALDDDDFKEYSPYFTNLMLSYHLDCLFAVSRLDVFSNIPPVAQYVYLLNTIRKKKRFTKLHRIEKDENVKLIQEYYGFSLKKAKNALAILSKEQINEIRQKRDKGGSNKDKWTNET